MEEKKEVQRGYIEIRPQDHFRFNTNPTSNDIVDWTDPAEKEFDEMERNDYDSTEYSTMNHFINDVNVPPKTKSGKEVSDVNGPSSLREVPAYMTNFGKDGTEYSERMFSGAMTLVNSVGDENYLSKEYIKKYGYSSLTKEAAVYSNANLYAEAPTSPLHPFTRMDPHIARKANLRSYNRFHIPVADLEFRKGFRHIFITRPECYIMSDEGLSDQAKYDEDFASIYDRMPHILKLLSPRYVSSANNLSADDLNHNWNFLLTNRVLGMSEETIENSMLDGVTKSSHNFTVSLGGIQSSGKEGSLSLSFRDTKYFEIFELIRMWMLYISKRHIGIFAPPYNGYVKSHNDFDIGAAVSANKNMYITCHPYDRAIEYPCTIFDIITDEADSKILQYNTYIGVYPYQMTLPLQNDAANAITSEARITVGFKYACKITNNTKYLVQFNYNAGITDCMGRPSEFTKEALPFLLKTKYEECDNKLLENYIGAASMFTGSPYIVMGASGLDPIHGSQIVYSPYLKFAPVTAVDINYAANLGITNIDSISKSTSVVGVDTDRIVASQSSLLDMPDIPTDESDIPLEMPSLSKLIDEIKKNGESIGENIYEYGRINSRVSILDLF